MPHFKCCTKCNWFSSNIFHFLLLDHNYDSCHSFPLSDLRIKYESYFLNIQMLYNIRMHIAPLLVQSEFISIRDSCMSLRIISKIWQLRLLRVSARSQSNAQTHSNTYALFSSVRFIPVHTETLQYFFLCEKSIFKICDCSRSSINCKRECFCIEAL